MKTKNWTLYEHICPNGKRYIGITCQEPKKRWHKGRGYKHSKAFYNAIEKYKWENIQHNILLSDLTEKEAKWLENYLICYYWTFVGFKDSKGYNMTLGGEGSTGHKMSEESRIKMSNSLKGKMIGDKHPMYGKHIIISKETRKKISEANKGKSKSEETRKKMSASKIGTHHSKETKKKISEANKGKTAWNKGIPMTEEQKIKLSSVNKCKPSQNKGKHISEETKKKISESLKGKHQSEESNKKRSLSLKGKNKGKTAWNKGLTSTIKGMHRVYHEDGTFHMER